MRSLFLLLSGIHFFFLPGDVRSQNIVINGGHELYIPFPSISVPFDSCFRELGPAGVTAPPNFPANPEGVGSACATPDHRCQSPRSGKAHGGYFHYSQSKFENPQYRLCEPLVIGESYQMTAWMRLAKGSGFACDRIGIWFTDWGYFTSVPQIETEPSLITEAGVFLEKDDYEPISFTWQASSMGDAVVIGNFLTKTNPMGSAVKKLPFGGGDFAYYDIDDLTIRPIPRIVGSDTVCIGQESVWYLANRPLCSAPPPFIWQVSDADTSYMISTDTLRLTIDQPTNLAAVLPEDTLYKSVSTITPADTFLWESQRFLCPGDTLTLDAGMWATASGHYWSTGDSSAQIQVTHPGSFTVSFHDGMCLFDRAVEISSLPPFLKPNWPDTILLCPGDTAILTGESGSPYQWSLNQATAADTLLISKPGSYEVRSHPESCEGNGIFPLTILDGSAFLALQNRIPNLFTPNGDGVNDSFKISDAEGASAYSLRIFSRWGRAVFQSDDPGIGWDGTYLGEPLPMDTYAYVLEILVTSCGSPSLNRIRGEVMLLR